MKSRQFTLRQWMIFIAVLGVLLAVSVRFRIPIGVLVLVYLVAAFPSVMLLGFGRARNPPQRKLFRIILVAFLFLVLLTMLAKEQDPFSAFGYAWVFCSLLSLPSYLLSWFTLRSRLSIEILILLVLLVYSAWTHPHYGLSCHADRAAHLAAVASEWAQETDDPQTRMIFDTEGAWFARKARLYRRCAFEYGLISFLLPDFADPTTFGDRGLMLDLGISQYIDWHEMDMVREHERLKALSKAQGP